MPRVGIGGLGQDDSSLADWASGSGSYDYSGDTGSGVITLPGTDQIPIFGSNTAPMPSALPGPVTGANQVPNGGFTLGPSGTSSGLFSSTAASLISAGVPAATAALVSKPSPVVSTAALTPSILTSSSLIPGIPDIVTIGGFGLLLILATSGGSKRR